MTEPARCRHWLGAERRYCGTSPARLYVPGLRCAAHTPARLAGRAEPGQAAYCPPGICWCGHCPAWKPAPTSLDTLDIAHADARRAGLHDPGHQLAVAMVSSLTAREGVA